jgi:hypothetical protein
MYLGIDIGTSSVKAVVVDGEQRMLAAATAPLAVSRPRELWSEQNPEDWWSAVEQAVSGAEDGGEDQLLLPCLKCTGRLVLRVYDLVRLQDLLTELDKLPFLLLILIFILFNLT